MMPDIMTQDGSAAANTLFPLTPDAIRALLASTPTTRPKPSPYPSND